MSWKIKIHIEVDVLAFKYICIYPTLLMLYYLFYNGAEIVIEKFDNNNGPSFPWQLIISDRMNYEIKFHSDFPWFILSNGCWDDGWMSYWACMMDVMYCCRAIYLALHACPYHLYSPSIIDVISVYKWPVSIITT